MTAFRTFCAISPQRLSGFLRCFFYFCSNNYALHAAYFFTILRAEDTEIFVVSCAAQEINAYFSLKICSLCLQIFIHYVYRCLYIHEYFHNFTSFGCQDLLLCWFVPNTTKEMVPQSRSLISQQPIDVFLLNLVAWPWTTFSTFSHNFTIRNDGEKA